MMSMVAGICMAYGHAKQSSVYSPCAAPVSKKQRKANAASPLDTGAGAADANSKPAKNDRAAATPAQTEKPKPQAQLAQAKVPRKKGAAAGAASGGDGADDDVNPAMLAALSSAMQKQECKRVSFETPGGADEDAAAAEVRPGKKQKQQREPHAGSQRVQTQQPGAAVEVPAGKGKGKQQQQQAPNAVPVAAQAKGVEGQTTAPADASGPKHGKDTGKKSVDPMSRDVNPDVSAHGRQAGKKQKEGHADKHVEEYQHQATHPSTQGKASKEGKEQPSTSQQQQPGALAVKPVMGKRLKRKLRQAEEAAKLASVGAGAVSVVGAHAAASTSSQEQLGAGSSKGSGLLERMRAKLAGGHFRYLNEQLYTRSGKDAFTMMQVRVYAGATCRGRRHHDRCIECVCTALVQQQSVRASSCCRVLVAPRSVQHARLWQEKACAASCISQMYTDEARCLAP